jgi:acyl-CoA dehydrogenase
VSPEAAWRAAAAAPTVGAAFLGAYRAAVASLTGVADAALAATESGALHPARVATTVADGRVTGHKGFVTGVPGAARAVVLAAAGADGGRVRLVCLAVELDAPGVTVTPQPPLPFVPDVPHAAVAFADAPGRLLPGDGWADVVKPFRTVEDTFVCGALAAWLLARAEVAGADAAALSACLDGFAAAAAHDPRDPVGHLALAEAIDALRAATSDLHWPGDPAAGAAWQRDRALLHVAERARAARTAAARAALTPT